jgi:prepilin signal peptidase PulO-like enzyme (type II secretory pathway)
MHVAAQRIVLTSPWKLGLFVFLLVAGTGFGLIWAYIELFGGQIDLQDEEMLRLAYAVLGAVAGLGLFGYIAVVSSARPLDRVVRNSREREQMLKRYGKIQDPRMIDIEDFEGEPALKVVLERWAEQAAAASDARLTCAAQSDALARLTSQLLESDGEDFHPEIEESTPDLDELVDAIKGIVSGGKAGDASTSQAHSGARADGVGRDSERDTWRAAAEQLVQCEQEFEGFVRSVSDHAAEIASRTGNLSKHSGALPREAATMVDALRRNGVRMGKVREASELLGQETKKLGLQINGYLSRAGTEDPVLMAVVDGLGTLASQLQRVASEAETAKGEQEEALEKLLDMEVSTLDSSAAAALAQQAMALDQHAEALNELLTRFRVPMQQIRGVVPELPPARQKSAPIPPAREVSVSGTESEIEAPEPEAFATDTPDSAGDTRDFGMASDAPKIYEIAELGGREIDDDDEDRIYDLDEFGAVEL